MKNILMILGLLLISNCLALSNNLRGFYSAMDNYTSYPRQYYPYPSYNTFNNQNAYERIKWQNRLNRIKNISNNINNFIQRRNINNGVMTGYSVPVNVNSNPYYSPFNHEKINPTLNQEELFSSPSGEEVYFQDGRYYKNLGTTEGKTGVRIIYD